MKVNTLENILLTCVCLFCINTYIGLWLIPMVSAPLDLVIILFVIITLTIYKIKGVKSK